MSRDNKSSRSNGSTYSVEGCPVIESGARCGERNNLSVINDYKATYDDFLLKLSKNWDDTTKANVEPILKITGDVWEQISALVKAYEDLESYSISEMKSAQRSFEQKLSLAKMEEAKQMDQVSIDDSSRCDGCDTERSRSQELSKELEQKEEELAKALDLIKEMDHNFKTTRWALSQEVAEKHDQILDLRNSLSTLEEQLRQADKQTHFKDDIIKKMRLELKELKSTSRSEGRKFYDVVTEATRQRKLLDGNMASSGVSTPREKLAALKEAVNAGIQRLQAHDYLITGIEAEVIETKRSMAELENRLTLESDNQSDSARTVDLACATLLNTAQSLERSISSLSLQPSTRDSSVMDTQRTFQVSSPHLGGGDHPHSVLNQNVSSSANLQVFVRNAQNFLAHIRSLSQAESQRFMNEKGLDSGNGKKLMFTFSEELAELEAQLEKVSSMDFAKDQQVDLTDLNMQLSQKENKIEELVRELTDLKENQKITQSAFNDNMINALYSLTSSMMAKLGIADQEQSNSQEEVSLIAVQHNLEQLQLAVACIPELRVKLEAQEKMVSNKEETLKFLHNAVDMREKQVEAFSIKVGDLERQLEEQRQVIADLQLAVQNCKKFEVKAKEDEICCLQFKICESERQQKAYDEEIVQKQELIELAEAESRKLLSKLNKAREELLNARQRDITLQKLSERLECDLLERDREIQAVQKQVQMLEDELESSEKRSAHDVQLITNLKHDVAFLQRQVQELREEYSEYMATADMRLIAEKNHAAETRHKLIVQNQEFSHTIRLLKYEIQVLNEQARNSNVQAEISNKVSNLESLLKLGEERHAAYDNTIADLKGLLEEKMAALEGKNTQLEALQVENKRLEASLACKRHKLETWEQRELVELDNLEKVVITLNDEKNKLAATCKVLSSEVARMEGVCLHYKGKLADMTDSSNEKVAQLSQDCAKWMELCEKTEEKVAAQKGLMERLQKDKEAALKTQKEVLRLDGELEEARHKLQLSQNEISHMEKLKANHDALSETHSNVLSQLRTAEKKLTNLEKLLRSVEAEKRTLEKDLQAARLELMEVKEDRGLLQEKVASNMRVKETEMRKLAGDLNWVNARNKELVDEVNAVAKKVQEYELDIVPELRSLISNQERTLKALKYELEDANESCARMRNEALSLINTSQKHLNANRMAAGDGRHVDEGMKALTSISKCLQAEFQRERGDVWERCRANDYRESSECHLESGFQSMMQSPTNMLYDSKGYSSLPEHDHVVVRH